MANRTRKNIQELISKPYKLILVYSDGYTEIASYDEDKESFNQFTITSENEVDALKEIIGISKQGNYRMHKDVYEFKDINNFSFILKKGWRTFKFLKIQDPNKVLEVEINKNGYSEIPTYCPELLFVLNNNVLSVYVKHKNTIYSNPLPNNMPNDSFCIGSADRDWETEIDLIKKIEMIKSMYIDSIFSHTVNNELLDSWFEGKPNIKLLKKKWSI